MPNSNQPTQTERKPINRLADLPRHSTDYAKVWWHEHDGRDIQAHVKDFNAYLGVMEELQAGRLKLPDAISQEVAKQIQRRVLREFRQHDLYEIDEKSNLYHKALYAYCIKRAVEALRRGEFDGAEFTNQMPAVADAIEARVDELFLESAMAEGETDGVPS